MEAYCGDDNKDARCEGGVDARSQKMLQHAGWRNPPSVSWRIGGDVRSFEQRKRICAQRTVLFSGALPVVQPYHGTRPTGVGSEVGWLVGLGSVRHCEHSDRRTRYLNIAWRIALSLRATQHRVVLRPFNSQPALNFQSRKLLF